MAFEQSGDPRAAGGAHRPTGAFTDPQQAFRYQNQRGGSGAGAGGGGLPPTGGGNTYINAAGVPGDTSLDIAGAYGAAPGAGPGSYGTLPSSHFPTESLMGGPPSVSPASLAGGGGSGLLRALDWLDPRTLAALGLSGINTAQSFRQPQGMEGLKELLGLSMDRARATGPLFNQMLTQAQRQMPDYTRQG